MNPFRDSLEMRPRPSRYLLIFVVAIHFFSALIVLTALMPRWPWAWLLLPAVLVSLGGTVRRTRLTHRHAVRRLRWCQDGAWVVETAAGRAFEAQLLPSSLSLPGLIVLQLRSGGHRFNLWLAPDSLDRDCARRLRARLRLARGSG